MTVAQSVITVDPRGRSMVVDVQTMAGVSVAVYDAEFGGSARSMPLTITAVTNFYLVAAGDYLVSALVGGVEIAGRDGAKRAVTPPAVGGVTVTPAVDQSEALGTLDATATSGTSSALADKGLASAVADTTPAVTVLAGTNHTVVMTGAAITVGDDFWAPGVVSDLALTVVGGSLALPDDDAVYDATVVGRLTADAADIGKMVGVEIYSNETSEVAIAWVPVLAAGAVRLATSGVLYAFLGDGVTTFAVKIHAEQLTQDATLDACSVLIVKR